ncbi:SMI1/KNR4 family protein [Nocardiopsis alba]|uniref:SMI1/KNR4 family protein n=1 Tax=Nocardiopsis alba TaxID=53437 RepID=UPI0033F1842B
MIPTKGCSTSFQRNFSACELILHGVEILSFGDLAASLHLEKGLVCGISESELTELRTKLGSPLPGAYEDFMRRLGRGAGKLFVGTDIFFPQVIDFQQDMKDFLIEEGVEEYITGESVAFASHQGYQVYWMSSRNEFDPTVLMHQEGESHVLSRWESFSDFIWSHSTSARAPQIDHPEGSRLLLGESMKQ